MGGVLFTVAGVPGFLANVDKRCSRRPMPKAPHLAGLRRDDGGRVTTPAPIGSQAISTRSRSSLGTTHPPRRRQRAVSTKNSSRESPRTDARPHLPRRSRLIHSESSVSGHPTSGAAVAARPRRRQHLGRGTWWRQCSTLPARSPEETEDDLNGMGIEIKMRGTLISNVPRHNPLISMMLGSVGSVGNVFQH